MFSSKVRQWLYLLLALSMFIFALPRLELGGPLSPMLVFGFVWLGLMLIVVMAHVNVLFLMDDEKRKQLESMKRAKAVLWERKLMQKAAAARRANG